MVAWLPDSCYEGYDGDDQLRRQPGPLPGADGQPAWLLERSTRSEMALARHNGARLRCRDEYACGNLTALCELQRYGRPGIHGRPRTYCLPAVLRPGGSAPRGRQLQLQRIASLRSAAL